MKSPDACASMAELRAQIDELDEELVTLLTRRAGYIDRAIELKPREGLPARIPARVNQVIANAGDLAERQGLDRNLAEDLWERLVEWSIHREERVLGASTGEENKD